MLGSLAARDCRAISRNLQDPKGTGPVHDPQLAGLLHWKEVNTMKNVYK